MRPWLYAVYFLFALILSLVISQLDFVATFITVALSLAALILWRYKRPQDFAIQGYLPRVFVAVTFVIVFFAGFLVLRKTQPMNYRANDLAALAFLSLFLALYFGAAAWKKRIP